MSLSQNPLSQKITHLSLPLPNFTQNKWESIPDSEKPAAIAIVIASVVAQIAIGATVDAVDRIPLISPFLEFVGLAVTSVYAYRYATDPAERCVRVGLCVCTCVCVRESA